MDVNKVMILVVFVIISVCSFTSSEHGSGMDNSTFTLLSSKKQENNYNNNNNAEATILSSSSSFTKKLSRKRRYLVFPEGSSFSVACCLTVGMWGNPSYTWISWAINWGLAYDLPNETYAAALRRKAENEMPPSVTQRKFKRDLYHRMEVAMSDMGYNGRECILRALCETSQLFGKKGTTMVKELLRTVFSLPTTKVLPFEHPDLNMYDVAYRNGKQGNAICSSLYPDCGFSLHGIALGKYSEPPLNYMM